MASLVVSVKIDSIALPAGRERLDPDDLCRRVELELAKLLACEPLRTVPPAGARMQAAGGRVHAASAATPASVAHAIARRIHTGLQLGEARR